MASSIASDAEQNSCESVAKSTINKPDGDVHENGISKEHLPKSGDEEIQHSKSTMPAIHEACSDKISSSKLGNGDYFHDPENLVQFIISGLKAKGLKKGMFFQPHPYVKLRIGPDAPNLPSPQPSQFPGGFGNTMPVQPFALPNLPHHGQNQRTQVLENTTEPSWDHEQFTFVGFPSDVLEIEVKDKFARSGPSISRILGRRKISLSSLFSKSVHRYVIKIFHISIVFL